MDQRSLSQTFWLSPEFYRQSFHHYSSNAADEDADVTECYFIDTFCSLSKQCPVFLF